MDPAPERLAPAVRDAVEDDFGAIQDIYAHHVESGLGSFEENAPDLDEIIRRWRAIRAVDLPYLVAELADGIRGYAYAAPYRPRSAYRHTVEDSIYIDPSWQRHGIGQALLSDLIERCEALGYRQMVAVIGDSGNTSSVGLHERCGFSHAGTLTAVGFKFGRWVDTVLMQRPLGQGSAPIAEQPRRS